MAYKFNAFVGKLIKSPVLGSYLKQGLINGKSEKGQDSLSSIYQIHNSAKLDANLRDSNIQTDYIVQNGLVRNQVINGPPEVQGFMYKLVKDKNGVYYNPRLKEVQEFVKKREEQGVPTCLLMGTRDYVFFSIYFTLLALGLINGGYVLYQFFQR